MRLMLSGHIGSWKAYVLNVKYLWRWCIINSRYFCIPHCQRVKVACPRFDVL